MATNGAVTSLEDFFTSCQELLFTADRSGALLGWSDPLGRALGSEVGKGTKLSARIHPEDRRAFRKEWTRISKSQEPVRFDCRLKGADGAYHAWSWFAQTSAKRGVIHGSLRNGFADRARSLEELEKQAAILCRIQDNIPICVWAIDPHGIFTHHAGKGLASASLAQGEWLGRSIFELYGGTAGALDGVQQSLKGEFTHQLSESHGVYWENWFIPIGDAEGHVTAVIGITLDISEAKRAEIALRTKLDLIERQQQVIRALTIPILEVWDRVVMVPLLGVFDSGRAAEVTEGLLTQVSKKGARFAILDLTGVEAMDTGTAAHLLRLIHAIRLLGAEGVISGIQPSVAQTMVSLGVDLKGIATLATLREALRHCMGRTRDGAASTLPRGEPLAP